MNGPKATSALSPFDSQFRTLVCAARGSHSCHERKSLPLCAAPLLPDMSRRDCPGAALNTPPLALAGRPADRHRDDPDLGAIEACLRQSYVAGVITYEQNQKLNSGKLRSRMPDDWNGVDPYARYREVGIRNAERVP
jgi:hypothetical protein